MKKKDYFIISAIIQIMVSISAIFDAPKLAKSLTETASMLSSDLNIIIKSGHVYIIVIASICIFLNILIIYYATKDNLLKNKEKIIACSVISIFTSTYLITELLAILNVIIMASSKRVNPEDYPSPKEKLPLLKKESIGNKQIIMAIVLLVVYFSQVFWSKLVPSNGPIKMIVGSIFYLLMITLSLTFFKDLLKTNFTIFKKHFKAYYQNIIPMIGKYYLVYILIAIVAAILCREISSVNQEKIMSLPIWYSMPLAIIYAPIVEETIFRGCIRRLIKNDYIFIIVSALSFGLLHTISSEATIYNTVVMALPYMTMGGFLAYLYVKTNNILCNMSFHCVHNTIALILSILIRL